MVQKLVDSKADVNAQARGKYTGLHYAAGRGNVDVVQKLVDLKADVNVRDSSGLFTPTVFCENYCDDKDKKAAVLEVLRKAGTS